MKILVTGAQGFTGRHFVRMAESAGHTVVPLNVDLRDRAAVAKAVAGIDFDTVLHLAGISFVGHHDEFAFYAVNALGTMNLLQALTIRKTQPQCVLLASSANVSGNASCGLVSETQLPAPVNHYAMSKLAMEHMARTYLDRLPIVLAWPFNYTGPGHALDFVIPKLVDHFRRRVPEIELGNLDIEREFNDVRMVCSSYLTLLDYGLAGEVCNICSGKAYSLRYVLDVLEQLAGYPIKANVSPQYVRSCEVLRLCGDPTKLRRIHDAAGVPILDIPLKETLRWMMEAEAA